eukprot:contig_1268_g178
MIAVAFAAEVRVALEQAIEFYAPAVRATSIPMDIT